MNNGSLFTNNQKIIPENGAIVGKGFTKYPLKDLPAPLTARLDTRSEAAVLSNRQFLPLRKVVPCTGF